MQINNSWHIPEALCSAIRYCLYPSQSDGNELAYIVHIADALAERNEVGIGEKDVIPGLEDGAAEFLGLKSEDLEHIMAKIVAAVDKTIESVTKS